MTDRGVIGELHGQVRENSSAKLNHRVQHRSLAEIKPAFPNVRYLKRSFYRTAILRRETETIAKARESQ